MWFWNQYLGNGSLIYSLVCLTFHVLWLARMWRTLKVAHWNVWYKSVPCSPVATLRLSVLTSVATRVVFVCSCCCCRQRVVKAVSEWICECSGDHTDIVLCIWYVNHHYGVELSVMEITDIVLYTWYVNHFHGVELSVMEITDIVLYAWFINNFHGVKLSVMEITLT
jgi:hypothetical protein